MSGSAIVGSILGTAIGDALGLAYEGVSRARVPKLFGDPSQYHLVLGNKGMVSDDTEHTCMAAQALIGSCGDPDRFVRSLGWRFRWWLVSLPAGVGLATARSIIKLWLGAPISRSGVYSAGNGPAMRSAVLGAAIEDPTKLEELVRLNTTITHTDPRALIAARVVAHAARFARNHEAIDPAGFSREVKALSGSGIDDEFISLVDRAVDHASAGGDTTSFAGSLGYPKGVTGYAWSSVPVAIHAWLRHPLDLRQALTGVNLCGGDTDSVGAITGGIIGAGVGEEGLPSELLDGLWEWPRSVRWMRALGEQLERVMAEGRPEKPVSLPVAGVLARNAVFLAIVLAHGVRRGLPPY